MKKVIVVIPSFRRAGAVTTHKLFHDSIVCIPESDYADYVKAGHKRETLVCHPDSLIGIVRKRNWMMDNIQGDNALAMFDDDLNLFCYKAWGVQKRLTRSEAHDTLEASAQLCDDWGLKIWGYHNVPLTKSFDWSRPIELTNYVPGCCMGFLPNSGMRFDERFTSKDDFDISLMHLHRYRIIIKDMRYGVAATGTMTASGGLSVYRNSESEARAGELLKEKYGDVVEIVKRASAAKQSGGAKEHVGFTKIRISLKY
jgi:hypothetical protein